MGVDQDAVEVGRGLGVKDGQSVSYARGKSREAMLATSASVRSYRSVRSVDPAAPSPSSPPVNASTWRMNEPSEQPSLRRYPQRLNSVVAARVGCCQWCFEA